MGKRRGYRRSRGGSFGMGRLLSMKNILFTVGAAYVAPKLGFNPQLGAALGGYMGAGIPGAVAGYVVGVPAANAASSVIGGTIGSNSAANYLA